VKKVIDEDQRKWFIEMIVISFLHIHVLG